MSKGLEALEKMAQLNDSEYIEKYYIEPIEKELKVLEIIKKKNIEIYWLKHSKDVNEYNKHITNLRDTFHLNEEEFILLKGVLENE